LLIGKALRCGALMERGLRRVREESKNKKRFKLRRASFKGKGLQPDFQDVSWQKLRDLTYAGRGS
jgi:hypothetical protein